MEYKLSTLKNGLRVLTVSMPSLESLTVEVWVKTGSRNEDEKTSGVSHFLEHMAFKGGKKYKTHEETSYLLDSLGAEYNAGTSQEWTSFYIKLRAEKLERAFDILSDMIVNANLNSKEIERERGVILEEIAMHEDTPMWKIGDIFNELIYDGNPLARDIAGTKETVKSITRADFINYRKSQYHTENMLITVSGGVKEHEVLSLSEKYFGVVEKGMESKVIGFADTQTKSQLKLKFKKTEQAHLILGFLGYPRSHKYRYAESLLATILGKGTSSRLFREVREKRGLAYSVHTSIGRYVDTGFFATYEGVKLDKVYDAVKVTLDQTYGLRDKINKVSGEELSKVKEYVKGRMALSLEDTASVNDFFGEKALFKQELRTPEEEFERLDKITVEDIYEVSKDLLVPRKLNLAIIGPYKDSKRFEKMLRI